MLNKKLKGVILLCMLTLVMATLSGCQNIDDSIINNAFANSSVMNSIHAQLQEQTTFVDEMYRTGIITKEVWGSLNKQVEVITQSVSTLTNGGTVGVSIANAGSTDASVSGTPTATPPPVEINSSESNPFIVTVLKSMSFFQDGALRDVSKYTNVTGLANKDSAAENIKNIGSYLDLYQGYPTLRIIEKRVITEGPYTCNFKDNNNTSYAGIAGYLKDNTPIPLYPFGDPNNTPVASLVERINSLGDMQVCYLNPDKVPTSNDLMRLKTRIDEAKSGIITDTELMDEFFYNTGKPINLATTVLDLAEAYTEETVSVYEGGLLVAQYHMYKLNEDAIRNAFGGAMDSGDFASGVVVGDYFFVTRYPVAVFRGFEPTTANTSKYMPVFTHPNFLSGTTYGDLKGSDFTGTSTYTEKFTGGDKGTAETKCAYVDLYTGAMYYKGEQAGNANTFMSVGTSELESAVLVKSSKFVYISDNNPNCITTVKQTKGFEPTESLSITSGTTVELPAGAGGGVMPVVFLMEYLELVYSPNTVSNDAFTAYGRKIRLDDTLMLVDATLDASTGTIAYIVGEGATRTGWSSKEGSAALKMSDFMDIDGFYKANLSAKSKDSAGEANNVTSSVRYIPAGTSSFEKAGTIRSGDAASERSDNLPQISANYLECTMMFGATNLDATDSSAVPKTPLYGITLYGGLYERALFSDWINASGNANLTKWSKTLADLGYKNYAISNAVLTEKMKGNYAFELNKDGLLHIDLDTVVQINKERVEERRGGGVMLLRTSLLILGFGLVAYVSVLLAAWALDVNLDLGFNMLEKVSFGHFVAVRSLDEMPDADPYSTTTYVDFGKLLIRIIAFATVGVILITIDPVNLIVKILSSLQFVFSVISEKYLEYLSYKNEALKRPRIDFQALGTQIPALPLENPS